MIEATSEIINEIETSIENIASQAPEHIHTDEVILTLGKSKTVEEFFKVFINYLHRKIPFNHNL